jgi:hypothetical protein
LEGIAARSGKSIVELKLRKQISDHKRNSERLKLITLSKLEA